MTEHLLFATSNPNKLKEVRKILREAYVVEGLDSLNFEGEIPETQNTIEGNAIQKVEFISAYTDRPVFAEDTGLVVPELNGAPGVHSARYAGEQRSAQDNMDKLLIALSNSKDRSAYFKTVLAYRDKSCTVHSFTGKIHGIIVEKPKGSQGFGYDPIFQPNGYSSTFAELDEDIKNTISHRRRAMDKFIHYLMNTDS